MKLIITLFTLLFSLKALATVNDFRITRGTSNTFDINITQEAWGVMAGPSSDPDGVISVDPTEVFDSCELPTAPQGSPSFPILPCHPQRVTGSTIVTITFTESEDFDRARNATAIFIPNDTSPNPVPVEIARSSALFTSGQPVTLEFTWADVCNAGLQGVINTSTGQCEDAGVPISGDIPVSIGLIGDGANTQISSRQINFRLYSPGEEIGIIPLGDSGQPCDSAAGFEDPTGLCEVLPIPGDGGAFLVSSLENDSRATRFINSSLSYQDSFPSVSRTTSINYTGIRLYFFESSDPSTYFPFSNVARIVDLDLNSSVPIDFNEDTVSGLENGVTYTVLASSIDESGTVSQFFLPTDNTTLGLSGYCPTFCPTVTPSQIAGVIADSDCFITTATYKSTSAYQVKTFQNFREHFLRDNFLGDRIIYFYDSYGPQAAVFLNNNSYLKPLVRVFLFPLYLFSKLSLNFGLFFSFVSLMLITLLAFKSLRRV